MDNNMKFDPMTGEPIQNNLVDAQEEIVGATNETTSSEPTGQSLNIAAAPEGIQIQNELQSIPTVEQEKEDFINNVQTINQEKQEEKKEGVNFTFIIILFVIILVSIYFLFPFLLKNM